VGRNRHDRARPDHLAVEAVNTLPGPAGLIVKFVAELTDGRRLVLASNENWKCHEEGNANWQQPDFDDQKWSAARVVGEYGVGPWGRVAVPEVASADLGAVGKVALVARDTLRQAALQGWTRPLVEAAIASDFAFPEAVVFVGDDCSLYRLPELSSTAYDSLSVTIFNPRNSRAFPEHDLPAPMKVGRRLYLLAPARPGVEPRLLVDAGRGALGSPSVTFDGRSILFAMAPGEESFFHIYRVPAEGGPPSP